MTTLASLVLVGSLRADSLNRRLAEALRDQAPAGVTVEIVEGLDDAPVLQRGHRRRHDVPAAAAALRDQVAAADRVLVVTPEYNGTMPAVLNNAIDWLSRPYGAGAIVGKPFGVVGATPTPYGGKWAHEDARRSAGIAGAIVVEDVAALAVRARGRRARPTPRSLARLRAAVAGLVADRGRRRRRLIRAARDYGRRRGRTARPDRARAGRPRPPRRGRRRSSSTEHYLERADRLDDGRRVRHAHARPGARAGRRPRRSARRRRCRCWGVPDRDQGPQPDGGGARRPSARRRSPTSCPTSPTGSTLSIEAAGHGQPRQDQHPGVRLALLHRARRRAARGDAVGPHPDGRRLLRRRGRRRRGRAGAGRPGLRRRRLDPDPGVVLRAGRAQAHPRPDQRPPACTATRSAWPRPGSIARTVRDAAALLDVLAGRRAGDPSWAPPPSEYVPGGLLTAIPGRLRIARFIAPVIADVDVDPECVEAWEDASRAARVARPRGRGRRRSRCRPRRSRSSRPAGRCSPRSRWCRPEKRAPAPAAHPLAHRARPRGQRARSSGSRSARCGGSPPTRSTALAPYDAVLTPTLADAAAAGRRDPQRRRPGRGLRGAEGASRRGPRRGTSPACRPSRCRCTGPPDGLPVGVMLAARPAEEELLLVALPPRSRRPRRGTTGGRRDGDRRVHTAQLSADELTAARDLLRRGVRRCSATRTGSTALGGMHALVVEDDVLVAHGSLVLRGVAASAGGRFAAATSRRSRSHPDRPGAGLGPPGHGACSRRCAGATTCWRSARRTPVRRSTTRGAGRCGRAAPRRSRPTGSCRHRRTTAVSSLGVSVVTCDVDGGELTCGLACRTTSGRGVRA